MKKTYQDRKAFIDRLEKKYIKKVQLHAFKRESEMVKNELNAMRGARVNRFRGHDFDFFDASGYRATYS